MTAMVPYDRYSRIYGAIRPTQLVTPKISPITRLSLPRGAVLHYFPETETEIGPQRDGLLLKDAPRLIFIEHVTALSTAEGNPRPTYVLAAPLTQQYRRNNMSIRPLSNYEQATKELLNVVVINYSIVGRMFKYMRSAMSRYWYWKNMRNTMWDKINSLNTPHERHHVVVMDTPTSLPGLNVLRRAESNMTVEMAKVFTSRERLDILDVFTWLGESREKSSMSRLDSAKYPLVDLMIRKDNGWITLNVGRLDEWRRVRKASMEELAAGQVTPVAEMTIQVSNYDPVRGFQLREGVVKVASMESMSIEFDDGTSQDIQLTDVSMEAAGGVMDPKVIQVRFLALLAKLIQATNVVQDAEAIIKEEESQDELPLPEDIQEKEEEKETDLQIIRDTDVEELLVEVEETLSEDLDKDGQGEKAEMTDDDGELIIESKAGKQQPGTQAVGSRQQGEVTLTSSIAAKCEELLDKGLITPAGYNRMVRLSQSYTELPDPWGKTGTLEEAGVIDPADLLLTETPTYTDTDSIRDKSMLHSTVELMDSQYVEKVMRQDIINCVLSVQHANVAVTGYRVNRVVDAVSDYEVHSISLTPVTGKPSTIQIRVPTVDKRGVYVSNGQRYRLRTQKADVPIRKVNHSRVALSSYYSKIFVDRSTRAIFDYDNWLGKRIVAIGLDRENPAITDILVADVADFTADVPRVYSVLARRVAGFKIGEGRYWFDYKNRLRSKLFTEEELVQIESKFRGMTCVGREDENFILLDRNDMFYTGSLTSDVLTEMGQIEDLVGLGRDKAPVSVAEISIFGKTMPIGIALAYLVGFDNLLEETKARCRVVPLGERLQISDDQYALRFLDETLVFEKNDLKSSLVFGGFLQYRHQIRQYSRHSFNNKDVYFTVLDANGIGLRYLRELDLMNAMFIDPITKGVLEWMKEPTAYVPLLLRACELLVTRYVPTTVETAEGLVEGLERAKGYERIPGTIYAELVRSIRVYNSRSANPQSQVTMNPHEVWTNIVQDPAAALVDDINPIQNLKQKEIITYGGRGGRSSRSMTAEARLYKEGDLGFISESTVDSGDVAVITYMTPNANITSVRGTVRTYDPEHDGASTIVSTAALISPCADRDDPKRVNFIGIQQSHVIATKGYRESPLTTGYEQVIAHRVDDVFAVGASQDGVVVEMDERHMVVEYADGTREYLDLETQYGISAGSVFPQEQATTFKLGDKVAKGDILKYNPGFFKPNRFHPRQVAWRAGVLARTALMEASYTLEDSSAIDDWLADQLKAEVTKVKTVVMRFDQTVRSMLGVGDHVDIQTILCTIEDAVTADSGLFNDEDLEALRRMSNATPRAGAVGKVDKIEIFYHGDPDDLSDSLMAIVQAGDRERRKKSKRLGLPTITGQVDQSLRIEGNGLDINHVAIKFYITHVESMGVGDKAVFSNQAKTVIGHRMSGINETESGLNLNAIFGTKSFMDRIILSPLIMGATITVLVGIGEKAAEMWMSDD